MIGKILASTKGKPCTCPQGKLCTPCKLMKTRKSLKPQIFVEEPKRLPVPIIVSYSKQNPVKIQDFSTRRRRWNSRKSRKQQYESNPCKILNFCQWYKRRKALKELIRENKREKERRRREEYEQERLNDLIRWEQVKRQYGKPKYEPIPRTIVEEQKEVNIKEPKFEPVVWPAPKKERFYNRKTKEKPITWSTPARKVKKKKTIKETSTTAKPRYGTKHVSVKKYDPKDTITNRFVNYCYRVCCQFYCCLTCILVIAFVVIFIL